MLSTILIIITVITVTMWTVVGSMLLSGSISHYEDIEMGLISADVDAMDFDAEPAVS